MPRFEFDQSTDPDDWVERSTRLLNLVVRGMGLVLLLTGLFVALLVISSAWSLYNEPQRIEAFARAVERGSNLDLTLSQSASAGRRQLETAGIDEAASGSAAVTPAEPEAQPVFRFSYFAAWLIVILLLLLIGRLAIAAVRTGGELALYDVQVRKLARALVREGARAER